MIKSRVALFLFLFVFFNSVKGQIFWTENFSNGDIKHLASGHVSNNGEWTVTSNGPSVATPNEWFIGWGEVGRQPGECSNDSIKIKGIHNGSLHISTADDIKATYGKGTDAVTDKLVSSPTIDLTGKSTISLEFNFICAGDTTNGGNDFCDLVFSIDNGATWLLLESKLTTINCSGLLLAMWRSYKIQLPPSANNNPNFRLGFHWKNNGDNFGQDPSFAVDSIRLSNKPSSGIATGLIAGSPFCACNAVNIPFTSLGTFDPANVYTAQLSDSLGGFSTPTNLGTLSSSVNSGVIKGVIPCNIKPGTKYRIRVKSSSPSFVGVDNGQDIRIDAPIKVLVTPNPDTICLGQQAKLKATGAQQYKWLTLPIITTSDSLEVSPIKDTVYVVLGTTGGCIDTAYARVYVNKPPIVKVTNDTICKGMVARLVASTNGSGIVKYEWNTGSFNDTLFEKPLKDTMYTVTVTKGRCIVKATGYVKVFDSIRVSVNSVSTCVGVPVKLTATGAISYVWNTIPVQTTSSITVSPLVNTVYTVTGTAGSCSNIAIATVTIVPGPDIIITATPNEICLGQLVSIKATGADTYLWDTGDTTAVIVKKPSATRIYTVVGKKAGCVSSANFAVNVSTPPTVTVAPASVCLGQTVFLIASGATTYVWNTNPKVLSDTLKITPTKDTSYTVFGFSGACIDTAVAIVRVGIPVQVIVSGTSYMYTCETAKLLAFPVDGTYQWEPSENIDCPTCPSVNATPLTTQNYIVHYTSPFGCKSSDSITVTVKNINSYYMPTALTPNGDGINDVVQVHGRGITRVSLRIFDRIGEMVFETNDIETPWDGTILGIPMNDNVFVYRLKLEYCDGVVVKETGNITIVR